MVGIFYVDVRPPNVNPKKVRRGFSAICINPTCPLGLRIPQRVGR